MKNNKLEVSFFLFQQLLPLGRTILSLSIFSLAAACVNHKMSPKEIAPSTDSSLKALSFTRDIQPIFQQNCIECHSASSTNPNRPGFAFFDDLSVLHTYGTKKSTKDGRYSVIQARLRGIEQPAMPYKRPALTDSLIQKIDAWTQLGAPVQ